MFFPRRCLELREILISSLAGEDPTRLMYAAITSCQHKRKAGWSLNLSQKNSLLLAEYRFERLLACLLGQHYESFERRAEWRASYVALPCRMLIASRS